MITARVTIDDFSFKNRKYRIKYSHKMLIPRRLRKSLSFEQLPENVKEKLAVLMICSDETIIEHVGRRVNSKEFLIF